MPVNKRSKFRGTRTCGGGTHKNRRGAGNRGGRGQAGWRDHNFTRFYLLGKTEGIELIPVRSVSEAASKL